MDHKCRPVGQLGAIDAVAAEAQKPAARKTSQRREELQSSWRIHAFPLTIALATLMITAGVYLWQPWVRNRPTEIAVRAAKPDQDSQSLASDLVTKLGSLTSAHSDTMQLIDQQDLEKEHPDLVLETASLPSPTGLGGSVTLKSGKDRTVLWSEDLAPLTASRT